MDTLPDAIDVVVIGAGQAGLATSHALRQAGIDHLVLERGRVGESWRRHRWRSFRLVSPNFLNRLPGYPYAGDDPEGFLSAADLVAYLEGFAATFDAPVRTGVTVSAVERSQQGLRVSIEAAVGGAIEARAVVIATGAHQRPSVPAASAGVPARILQLHAHAYQEPAQLPPGEVLVVGGGQSGSQIAIELARSGRAVVLSTGRCSWYPRRLYGHDILWWRDRMGEFETLVDELPDPAAARVACTPLIRAGAADLNLRAVADEGVTLVGRLADIRHEQATFHPDLHADVRWADDAARAFVARIHAFAVAEGAVDADALPPSTDTWRDRPLPPVITAMDLAPVTSIVWATGYRPDLGWVRLPITDDRGSPIQRGGVSPEPGVYLMGLHLMHRRGSGFVLGVGQDAHDVVRHIRGHLAGRSDGPAAGG